MFPNSVLFSQICWTAQVKFSFQLLYFSAPESVLSPFILSYFFIDILLLHTLFPSFLLFVIGLLKLIESV